MVKNLNSDASAAMHAGAHRVGAVVVTYNRKKLLAECLDALLAQTRPVNEIFVVDNASSDGTSELIANHYSSRVYYERLPVNIGGAGGFRHGMKLAYGRTHSWIWVMDDDAQPAADCLEALLSHARDMVGFLSPLVLTPEGALQAYHHKRFARALFVKEIAADSWLDCSVTDPSAAIELDANGFVGPLVNSKAIATVGLPESKFFICWDDTEYTYRITRRFKSYVVPAATLVHKDKRAAATAAYGGNAEWKTYYVTRNAIFFVRAKDGVLRSWMYACYLTLRALCGAVKPGAGWTLDNRLRRLSLRLRAAWDGFRNNGARTGVLPPAPAEAARRTGL